MSTEIAKTEKKEMSQVAKALQQQEMSMGSEIAMQALKLVEPMIESVATELENTLGDNETIIVIRRSKITADATIVMLNTAEDFTIQGAKANRTKSNKERDKYLKKLHEEGKISEEDWALMNTDDLVPVFKGEMNPATKKPFAIKQFYVIREFVTALLSGRMEDITKQLMK